MPVLAHSVSQIIGNAPRFLDESTLADAFVAIPANPEHKGFALLFQKHRRESHVLRYAFPNPSISGNKTNKSLLSSFHVLFSQPSQAKIPKEQICLSI